MPGDRMPGMPAVAPLAASSEASTTDRRWSNDSEVYSPVPPSGTMPRLPASTMRRTWALHPRLSTPAPRQALVERQRGVLAGAAQRHDAAASRLDHAAHVGAQRAGVNLQVRSQ